MPIIQGTVKPNFSAEGAYRAIASLESGTIEVFGNTEEEVKTGLEQAVVKQRAVEAEKTWEFEVP